MVPWGLYAFAYHDGFDLSWDSVDGSWILDH